MYKKMLLMLLIMISIMGYWDNENYFASKDTDLFKEIVEISKGKPVECGIKINFDEESNGEEYYLNLMDKLDVDFSNTKLNKDNRGYCLEFSNGYINGYIESKKFDNHNVVTIEVEVNSSENVLPDLKDKVMLAIGKEENQIKLYQYLKAKVTNDNLYKINNDIALLLTKENALNINTIEIENGYSTVAYTKKYAPLVSNGSYTDFNYAVCRYSSGNYVVVGTPIIMTTY